MPRAKPMQVSTATPHPFMKAFPKTAATVLFIAAVVRLVGAITRRLWPWRRELLTVQVLSTVWLVLWQLLPTWWALLVLVATVAAPFGRREWRVWWSGWLRC